MIYELPIQKDCHEATSVNSNANVAGLSGIGIKGELKVNSIQHCKARFSTALASYWQPTLWLSMVIVAWSLFDPLPVPD
jgi:hypothetical protein